ncbi:MAG: zinc ribbon domain-containing protein [Blastocatellia bacterium]|nr:zinc ribbon domain-containing protein [Blastocatellia bacterium]
MFCPSCGTETNDQTKFCTKCGINLRNIKEAMVDEKQTSHDSESHVSPAHPGWPWWAEIALRDAKRSPEEKRINEIKGGVITSCVGFSLIIFLYLLLGAVSLNLDPKVVAILNAVRFVGIIPFMIGLGLVFNGMFVSKRLIELKREQEQPPRQPLFPSAQETTPVQSLHESPRPPFVDFSVTETTTTKLQEPAPIPANRETN